VIATTGADRWIGTPVDVKAGRTTDAGLLTITPFSGVPGHGADGPFWRGDGKRVGYFGPLCGLFEVPLVPPLGHSVKPLLGDAARGLCIAAWGPAANADKLALGTVGFDAEGRTHLYVADERSAKLPAPIASFDRYRRISDLHWRPSGKSFVAAVQDDLVDEDMNLVEVDVASGKLTKLTDFHFEGERLRRFALSPDGKTVVFERAAELARGGSDLWVARVDGSGMRRLVAGGGFPAWNPTAR
jgi:hypothetical protein